MLRLLRERSTHKLLANWFFSYVVILLISILINTVMISIVQRQYSKNAEEKLEYSMDQVRDIVDELLIDFTDYGINLAQNSKINDFLYNTQSPYGETSLRMIDIIKHLSFSSTANRMPVNTFLFKNSDDLVISSSGTIELDLCYKYYLKKYMSPADFNSLLVRPEQAHVRALSVIRNIESADTRSYFCFVQSLPVINPNPQINLFLAADTIHIAKTLDAFVWSEGIAIYMLDMSNQVIISSSSAPTLDTQELNMINNNEITRFSVQQTDYMSLSTKSNLSVWRYLIIIPDYLFLRDVRLTWYIFIINVIACFVVGVALSYIFSARNYDPVNKLVKKVEQAAPNTDHTVNELKLIENAFLTIVDKNRELNKKLNENQDILQAAVLSDLIKGNFASSDEIEHMCQELQIEFPFERFILLYIPPEISEDHSDRDSCLYINDLKSLASIAEYTIEAYLINNINHHTKFYIIVENNSILCLLNTTARTAEEHNRNIYGIARQLQILFEKTFKKPTPVFISKACHNIMDLAACQHQLHIMTDYRAVFASMEIVSYNQMEDATITDNSLLEQEIRYANAVERGDYSSACSIIEQTIVDYFTPLKRSIYAVRQYIINLSKYMPLANYNLEDNTDIKLQVKGQDLKKTITSCQTADDIIVAIKKLFSGWSAEAKDDKVNDERNFIGKVIRYIDENYCDVNLNVSTTAIHFNTNISYLSRAFKKNTGIRLLDYINRKRLHKSISLLKQMPLENVIRQSGFSNIVSYIRIFKKQFGTTPGKYRDNI